MISVEDRIQDFINERIAPSLAMHGGSVDIVKFSEGTLELEFLGSCDGCGVQNLTSDSIIDYLMENFSEIKDVIILNENV